PRPIAPTLYPGFWKCAPLGRTGQAGPPGGGVRQMPRGGGQPASDVDASERPQPGPDGERGLFVPERAGRTIATEPSPITRSTIVDGPAGSATSAVPPLRLRMPGHLGVAREEGMLRERNRNGFGDHPHGGRQRRAVEHRLV